MREGGTGRSFMRNCRPDSARLNLSKAPAKEQRRSATAIRLQYVKTCPGRTILEPGGLGGGARILCNRTSVVAYRIRKAIFGGVALYPGEGGGGGADRWSRRGGRGDCRKG